jgi:O-antigen/teichoic acid export membrane protein
MLRRAVRWCEHRQGRSRTSCHEDFVLTLIERLRGLGHDIPLVHSFGYLGVAELAVRVTAIASFVIVSRTVGPIDLGHLALAIALVSYGAVLGDGGLTIYVQRQIAAGMTDVNRLVTAATVTQLGLASVFACLLVIVCMTLAIAREAATLAIVMMPLLLAQAMSLVYVLQARELMKLVGLVRVLTQGTVAAITIGLVLATHDVIWAALAYWLGALLGDFVALRIIWRRGLYRPVGFPPTMVTDLLAKGLPFLGIGFATQLLSSLDLFMLGLLRSPQEVGEYGASLRLVQFAFSLTAIMAAATFPQLARRYAHDVPAFVRLVETLVSLSARVTFAGTAFVVLQAPIVVPWVFGDEFAASGGITQILVWWVPLGFYNTILGQALLASGQQKTYLRTVIVAAVAFGAMLAILVPPLGPSGSAAAVIGRELVILAMFTSAGGRALGRVPLVPYLREAPYLVLPLAVSVLLQIFFPATPFLVAAAVWLIAVLLTEAGFGWPTLRRLRLVA